MTHPPFVGPTNPRDSVWESEEAYRTFEREKLIPVFERLGMSRPIPRVSIVRAVAIAHDATLTANARRRVASR